MKPRGPSGSARHNSTINDRRTALLLALAANGVFLVVELAGGFLFGSLALLADAAHMVSDVVALGLAYGAVRLAQRPPTRRHTFGFGRTEVLVAQANAVLLFAGAIAVIVAAWRLLRDATSVLLEAVPAGLDVDAVTDALFEEPGVEAVHHLHVWTTGSEHAALSAHVVLGDTLTLHDAQLRAVELKQMLHERFGIDHATLEVECHACVDDEVHVQTHSHSHSHDSH